MVAKLFLEISDVSRMGSSPITPYIFNIYILLILKKNRNLNFKINCYKVINEFLSIKFIRRLIYTKFGSESIRYFELRSVKG